jgi:hypothetical protein
MASANICLKCGSLIARSGKCSVCGARELIPVTSPLAQKMIAETGQGDMVAAVTHQATRDARYKWGAVAIVIGTLIVGAVIAGNVGPFFGSKAATPAAANAPSDDAELLLSRCGPPSLDDSTASDSPRPPIVSRTIEYSSVGLRIMFIPDGNIGAPPPYRWKLVGVTDIAAPGPSQARIVQMDEVARRLPCWAPAK